ncbi:MAG TPA: biotin/lipoyl-containing protein, partial [Ktedonobacterales bacterium]|nr:biotin/lipoyl-containing protein [Ktedonobacterales bacterium]
MPTKITMPQLGESVAEGTIGQWLKSEGDLVKKDESLVEIITDKVTAELPSPVSGRLVKILVQADETVKVGVDIAEIDESGATASTSASAASAATTAAADAPAVGTPGASAGPTLTGTTATPTSTPVAATIGSAAATNGSRAPGAAVQEKVSPLARRLAQEHQIDLNEIRGTGEGGRIRKEDILAVVDQRGQQVAAPISAAPAPSAPRAPTSPMPPAPP